jgi:hypothetical protein
MAGKTGHVLDAFKVLANLGGFAAEAGLFGLVVLGHFAAGFEVFDFAQAGDALADGA